MRKKKKGSVNFDKPIKLKVRVIGSKTSQKKKVKKNIEAPPEQYFWLSDGLVLKNLSDLQKALETMSSEQYDYHTKDHGNDFAKWIEDVLKDNNLAKKFSQFENEQVAAKALKKYIT
jgi:hypothetical protein